MPKPHFQRQLLTSMTNWIFLKMFVFSKHQFFNHCICCHFLITSIFEAIYFLKWCPIFDGSALCLFKRYNSFLWVLMHTVSSQVFRSFRFLSFFLSKIIHCKFFVKSQSSLIDFGHLTIFSKHYWFFMSLNPIFI